MSRIFLRNLFVYLKFKHKFNTNVTREKSKQYTAFHGEIGLVGPMILKFHVIFDHQTAKLKFNLAGGNIKPIYLNLERINLMQNLY